MIVIAAALIEDGRGNIFLVRKSGSTTFMQAGGKVDPGETVLDALARELVEELRFRPSEGQARWIGIYSAKAANEPGQIVQASLFHIRADCSFEIGAELEEALWVSVADARKLQLAPLTRDYVIPLAQKLS